MRNTPSNQLLAQFRARGDEAAFQELVDRYAGLVCAAAARRLGRRSHLAPDVAQLMFCALAKRAGSSPSDVVIPAWLHTVAVRRAISMIRSETRREGRERAAAIDLDPVHQGDSPEIAAELDDAIASLARRDREALVVRYLDGHDVKQTAEILGISYEAAKKRIARALDRLRRRLGNRGIATASAGIVAYLGSPSVQAAPEVAAGVVVDLARLGIGGESAAGMLAGAIGSIRAYPAFAAAGVLIASLVGISIATSKRARPAEPMIKEPVRLTALGTPAEMNTVQDEPRAESFELEASQALPVEELLAGLERLAMASIGRKTGCGVCACWCASRSLEFA